MRNHKRILALVICCALFSVLPFQSGNIQIISVDNDHRIPAAIDILDIMPDSELDIPPDAFVNGTSGEFQYSHQPHDMQMNWTHTEGTELDFHSSDDKTFPQFNDFVYFTQTFDWPYEDRPNDAEMYLNFSTSLSGNFSTEAEGGLMFRLCVWLIDSSGNWWNTYYSFPPYYAQIREIRINFDGLDIANGWNGMIEDDYGVQEDPQDELSVCVGLVPTEDFLDFEGSQPWQTYSGSVGVSVSSLELYVIMDAEPNPATHLDPLYNETYGAVLGDVYSSVTLDSSVPSATLDSSYPMQDRQRAMITDPSGNVYITGESYSGYDLFSQTGFYQSHQFIVKYNPTLNRQWVVRNDNLSRGSAVTYHEDNIYTSGCYYYRDSNYRDVMVTKWTPSGQKVWESEWGGPNDQVGIAIGVHNDSSVYVMVSDFNHRSAELNENYDNTTLLKLDSSGSVLWSKSLQLSTAQDIPGKMWVFESYIMYWIDGAFMCMDLNGDILWGDVFWTATVDENGYTYATRPGQHLEINRISPEGNVTWTSYFDIEYPNGRFEWINPCDISLTSSNELLVLVQGGMYDYSYFLMKYDLNGTLIQQWSIGSIWWPYPGSSPLMEAASTGLVYFSFNLGWDVLTQGYTTGDYTIPPISLDTMNLIVIGGGIGVIALVGVYVYKKKQVS